MYKLIIYIGLVIFILSSCEKNKNNDNNRYLSDNDLIIKTGIVCGWCGGADSLIINIQEIEYSYYLPCDEEYGNKKETTKEEIWNSLLSVLDLKEFLKVDLNVCNVCVDGCDKWIYIENDTISHRISFWDDDSLEFKNIKPLIDELEKIRNGYRYVTN
jgi:hypothetical protein